MPVGWTHTVDRAEAKIGRLGTLLVHKVSVKNRTFQHAANCYLDYKVVVFGMPLYRNAATLEEGKARALFAARAWVAEATQRLSEAESVSRTMMADPPSR